jgi:hypothetical protein
VSLGHSRVGGVETLRLLLNGETVKVIRGSPMSVATRQVSALRAVVL